MMNPYITRATPSKIILPKLGAHDDVSESDEMSIMNPNITRATPSKVILSKLGAHDDVSESDEDTVSQRYRRRYVLPRRERNRYSFGKDTVSQRHRRRYIQPRRELSRYSTGNTSILNLNKTRATPSRIILPKLGAHEDVSETDQVHCDSNDFCQKVSPAKRIEIWEFDGKNRFTTVSETWSVSACIRHVKDVLKVSNDVDLWSKNQFVLLEIGKSLSDYAALTKLFVVIRPHNRYAISAYRTSEPDVMGLDDDDCVLMSCGHATAPESLYNYYWNEIKSGKIEVRCPALPDENNKKCQGIWEFEEVRPLACLSSDERMLFLSVLFTNWLEKNKDVFLCPQCDEAVVRSCKEYFECCYCKEKGKSHSFCIRCLRVVRAPWMLCRNSECEKGIQQTRQLLSTCSNRVIIGISGCPTVRACPVCQCIIEFGESDRCKHMICPNRTCRTRFCFICLSTRSLSGYFPCGGAFDKCYRAPRQKVH